MTADEARAIALGMANAVEADHHGRPSFRVGGRIFATLWTEDELNVFVDPEDAHAICEQSPDTCVKLWWGRKLSGVKVMLPSAEAGLVAELLEQAWERRASGRR